MNQVFIIRSSDIACRKLEGEMIIMSVRDSTLFTLNEVATAIWEAADGRTPVERIVEDTVCQKYEVDRETALQDALELVHRLASSGLLRLADSPFDDRNTQERP
jgi:hypothetical protein